MTNKLTREQLDEAIQLGPEIKSLYEAEANAYTDAKDTKLTGIETGAEANQTDSEIKTQYENNADTNAFTDAEQSKLAGVEAGAQVNKSVDLQIAQSVTIVNTASTTFVDLPDMTLTTPNDGITRNYKILFNGSFDGSVNNEQLNVIVNIGGANVANTDRGCVTRNNQNTICATQHVAFSVPPNTVIKIQWSITAGNIDALERSLIIEGVAV